jgi:hypothetical protein
MENLEPVPNNQEEIESELSRIASQELGGVPPGRLWRAAQLFARMHDLLKPKQERGRVQTGQNFSEWARTLNKNLGTSRRNAYYFLNIGRYLLPRVTESDLLKLGLEKAKILAQVEKAGRWSQELLDYSLLETTTAHDLEDRVAPLLGKKASWTEHLRIDGHEAAVAALLLLGNRHDFETYTAHPGNQFSGTELGKIATLRELPRFATDQTMRSISRIDVIWLKDDYPEYFFEVENTTDVTFGLHRMFQAKKYAERFFIVGPKKVKGRFLRETEKAPYREIKQKYLFRSYDELLKMFRIAMKYCDAHGGFFDKEE